MNAQCPPAVSVCIANYNGETFIRECIESVLNQVDAPAFEIIVHDDASTDRSVDYLASVPQVTLMRSAQNAGYCVANNRMAERSSGEYLLLLNNDATLQPDALATLIKAARAWSRPAILGLRQYDYHSRALIDAGESLDIFMCPVPILSERTEAAMVIGACLWIPRTLWQELGGFPTWFQTNAEDIHLCCLARMRGYKVHVPQESGYMHRVGATLSERKIGMALVSTRRRRYLSERNRTRLMCMFYPIWLLAAALPLHIVALLLEGIVVSVYNLDFKIYLDVYMRTITDTIRDTSIIASERKQIMSSKQKSFVEFLRPFRFFPQKARMLFIGGLPRVH